MRTTVYMVRHAHSNYSTDELSRPLSERGHEDARKVTELLIHEPIDAIISSPYKRAIETIQGVATQLHMNIIIEENFRERLLSAEPVINFEQAIRKVWGDYSFSWDGGESNNIAQQRASSALISTLSRYEGQNVVISSHGNIMVLMMNFFDQQYGYSFWKQLQMPDIYKLTFEDERLLEVTRLWD